MFVLLESVVRCPECGAERPEVMPVDSCQYYWDCPVCDALINAKPGDCCVYCSYGTVPCPPVQAHGRGSCCGDGDA